MRNERNNNNIRKRHCYQEERRLTSGSAPRNYQTFLDSTNTAPYYRKEHFYTCREIFSAHLISTDHRMIIELHSDRRPENNTPLTINKQRGTISYEKLRKSYKLCFGVLLRAGISVLLHPPHFSSPSFLTLKQQEATKATTL